MSPILRSKIGLVKLYGFFDKVGHNSPTVRLSKKPFREFLYLSILRVAIPLKTCFRKESSLFDIFVIKNVQNELI